MKTCVGCIHAKWLYAKNGSLHPSGNGECGYLYKFPALPASMYWMAHNPIIGGGQINRREELNEHCAYWTSK